MQTYADLKIELLREECRYDPDRDASIDSLIDYKDALEDRYAELIQAVEPIAQHQREGWGCGVLDGAISELRRVLNDGIPVSDTPGGEA